MDAEAYLERYPAVADDAQHAVDLIYHEFLLREKAGEQPTAAAFAARFPAYAALLQEQIELHLALAAATASSAASGLPSELLSLEDADDLDLTLHALPPVFGRYRIVRQVGQGGMGAVFLAQDTQLQRQVALKVPRFAKGASKGALQRFYREARIAASFQHPNLCPVYDVGEIDGVHYLTMPFVSGDSLATLLHRKGRLPTEVALGVALRVAHAMAAAHAMGVIHRDLKPSNIMVKDGWDPVVMDFGLARRDHAQDAALTSPGVFVGTPIYMAPEQIGASASDLGPACDIYSLGVVLYEMLAGRPPFQGKTREVLQAILTQEPPPLTRIVPNLSGAVERFCVRALAKDPHGRPGSMEVFAEELAGLLDGAGFVTATYQTRPSSASSGNPLLANQPASRETHHGELKNQQTGTVLQRHPPADAVKPWRSRHVRWLALAMLAATLLALFFWPRGRAAPDALQAGSHWIGRFSFQNMNYTGDVEVTIARRDGKTFEGTYSTEGGNWVWQILGTAEDGQVRWDFIGAIHEKEARSVVGQAEVTGTYQGTEMNLLFHHRGNGAKAEMRLRLAR
jgi:serine/threonine protein kinase